MRVPLIHMLWRKVTRASIWGFEYTQLVERKAGDDGVEPYAAFIGCWGASAQKFTNRNLTIHSGLPTVPISFSFTQVFKSFAG